MLAVIFQSLQRFAFRADTSEQLRRPENEFRSLRMQILEATSLTQCSFRTFSTGSSYVLIYQVQPKK